MIMLSVLALAAVARAQSASSCWSDRLNGYWIEEQHRSTGAAIESTCRAFEEAMRVCEAVPNCHGIATQINKCGGLYRVTQGDTATLVKGGPNWEANGVWSYTLDRACMDATPEPAPASTPALCPWLTSNSGETDVLVCGDGTRCYAPEEGWSCCKDHGGRALCPSNNPNFCQMMICGGQDYCCGDESSCAGMDGLRDSSECQAPAPASTPAPLDAASTPEPAPASTPAPLDAASTPEPAPASTPCIVADIVNASMAGNVVFRYKDDRADLAGATVYMESTRNGGGMWQRWSYTKSTATFDGGFWVSTMWNTGIVWAQRMVVNGSVVHTWDSFTDAPVDSCTAEPVIPTPAPVVPAVLTPAPVVSNDPRCPWLNESSGEHDVIVCGDGTRCNAETAADGWSCCNNHGGRALCPSNYPNFCKMMNLCGSAKDYCCGDEDTCAGMNGLRECKGAGNEHFPAPAPASTPAPLDAASTPEPVPASTPAPAPVPSPTSTPGDSTGITWTQFSGACIKADGERVFSSTFSPTDEATCELMCGYKCDAWAFVTPACMHYDSSRSGTIVGGNGDEAGWGTCNIKTLPAVNYEGEYKAGATGCCEGADGECINGSRWTKTVTRVQLPECEASCNTEFYCLAYVYVEVASVCVLYVGHVGDDRAVQALGGGSTMMTCYLREEAAEPVIPTPAPVVVPTPAPVVSNLPCEDIKDKRQCKQSPKCEYKQKKCSTAKAAKACSEIKNKRECKSRKNKKRCKVKKTKTEVDGNKVKTNTCVDKVVE